MRVINFHNLKTSLTKIPVTMRGQTLSSFVAEKSDRAVHFFTSNCVLHWGVFLSPIFVRIHEELDPCN